MSKVKGRYVATLIISMDATEGENDLLNYGELKRAWNSLGGEIKKDLEEDLGISPQIGSVEVIEQMKDFYKVDDEKAE